MQSESPEIILASASAARASILASASLSFQQRASSLDEAAEHEKFGRDLGASGLASRLADLKARLVADVEPNAIIIGADQVLSFGGEILQKPADRDAAREQLRRLRGHKHELHSAVTVLHNDNATSFADVATLTMREFSDAFLDWYLETAGDGVLTSVGAYHLEGLGIHLFEKIDGDYFTILGLPIVPVLNELRRLGVLEA